jgi:hypothetical protein
MPEEEKIIITDLWKKMKSVALTNGGNFHDIRGAKGS